VVPWVNQGYVARRVCLSSFRALTSIQRVREGSPLSSPTEDEAQRHKKQQWIRRQVKAGKLVVRQMTPDERAKFPPVPEAGQGRNARS
jgi:hypothetical protein